MTAYQLAVLLIAQLNSIHEFAGTVDRAAWLALREHNPAMATLQGPEGEILTLSVSEDGVVITCGVRRELDYYLSASDELPALRWPLATPPDRMYADIIEVLPAYRAVLDAVTRRRDEHEAAHQRRQHTLTGLAQRLGAHAELAAEASVVSVLGGEAAPMVYGSIRARGEELELRMTVPSSLSSEVADAVLALIAATAQQHAEHPPESPEQKAGS